MRATIWPMSADLSADDLLDLRYAKSLLSHPSLAARVTSVLGAPIEKGFALLPANWADAVNQTTRNALTKAIALAVATMDEHSPRPAANFLHKLAVTATGAGGGVFGFASLPLELPLSTTIMLRSIVDVARSEGEKIKSIETKLACMEVFALGGSSAGDDAANTGYFAVRAALAKAMAEAAGFIAERGVAMETAPAIVRLIGQIATRFGVVVSEKMAAQAVPVIGAIGGASINLLFIDHFQDIARGHFVVRRLERKYGPEAIKAAYEVA